MYIEEYGFDRNDLIVVTAVKAYLKKLTPEARMEVLSEIVKKDGVIDERALSFIQEHLPALDGKKYVKKMPEKFLRFITDCATEE